MKIHIGDIKSGMIVDSAVKMENGRTVVLQYGTKLTDNIIKKLYKLGIEYIDIKFTKEEEISFKQSLASLADKGVETTVPNKIVKEAEESIRNFNTAQIINNARSLTQSILKSQDFKYSLVEYKRIKDMILHSIRTASFSVLLAKYYNDTLSGFISDPEILGKCKIDLEALAIAAMLHDIGQFCNDKKVLDKVSSLKTNLSKVFPLFDTLNLEQYNEQYLSIYSYLLLKDNNMISPDIKMMILLSGEDEIGDGPLKPDSNYINSRQNFIFGSKIIRLCSMYDETLENTIGNKSTDENVANGELTLENISSKLDYCAANGIINEELEKLFIEHIPLYSKGVKVTLSNGDYAVVEKSFKGRQDICKPIVRTIPDGEIIDLRKELRLTIQEICSDEISFTDIVSRQLKDMENEILNGFENTLEEEKINHQKI